MSDAESEACETQVWVEFAVRCKYLDALRAQKLSDMYDQIMGQLVKMIEEPDKWLIKSR
jgi:four helix bundle protein